MGYYLYDEDGYVADVGTTKGLDDMFTYLRGLDLPGLDAFIENGWDLVPEALAEELEVLDPPAGEVKDTIDDLVVNLRKCKGMAIVSDGLNEDPDMEVEENAE